LKWEDFKAKNKPGGGFAVATSTCGFGYDGIIKGDEISVNVYVRFYCNESWHHNNYKLSDVLKHEQLHFDICELYGRILYKNIMLMRKKGQLNERNLKKVLNELMVEYDETQDRYDDETNHSTDGLKQQKWNKKIANALHEFAKYANYKEF
jgi:multimeric flavodoxin WrbA